MSDSHQLQLGGVGAVGAGGGTRFGGPLVTGGPNRVGAGGPSLATGDVQHVSHLSEDIGALYMNDDYSDVLLRVDGTQFRGHKVILAARSEYFRALLYGGMKEAGQDTIDLEDITVPSFRILLKYIYTGKLTLTNLKEDLLLDTLGLAHKFGFSDLETSISEYLKAILNTRNLCTVFGASHLYCLTSLTQYSLDFADKHASDILNTEGFLHLTPTAVEELISRDSFCAAEIEIFRAVREWVRHNPEQASADSIMSKIRLSLMKLDDLLNIVRPSGLILSDVMLDAIKEQTEKRDMELRYRGYMIPDVNVTTLNQGASVIEGELKQALLNGDTNNYDMERGFTRHPIETGSEGIIVQLGAQCILNHIRLLLWDRDQRSYSYYVEVSMDRKDWVRVADYSNHLCRAWQHLYFHPKVVKYIRVMGTNNTVNRVFHLIAMEAYYTSKPYNVDPSSGILIPSENMATIEGCAIVTEGVSRSRNALVNGDTQHYDWDSGYTCHQLGSGAVVVQLPQPYLVDSMRLLLWDCDDRHYSYYIEVSTDQQSWKKVADKSNEECRGWQYLTFDQAPVAFVKIVGTHNSANEVFHCVHFECPANPSALQQSNNSAKATSNNNGGQNGGINNNNNNNNNPRARAISPQQQQQQQQQPQQPQPPQQQQPQQNAINQNQGDELRQQPSFDELVAQQQEAEQQQQEEYQQRQRQQQQKQPLQPPTPSPPQPVGAPPTLQPARDSSLHYRQHYITVNQGGASAAAVNGGGAAVQQADDGGGPGPSHQQQLNRPGPPSNNNSNPNQLLPSIINHQSSSSNHSNSSSGSSINNLAPPPLPLGNQNQNQPPSPPENHHDPTPPTS